MRTDLELQRVRALAKDLTVKRPGDGKRSDQDIAAAALLALDGDAEVPHGRLQVEVENGYVTLKGKLYWNYQRAAAECDVRKLSGVVGVSNQITLKPISAEKVRSKIESALQRLAVKDSCRSEVRDQIRIQTGACPWPVP